MTSISVVFASRNRPVSCGQAVRSLLGHATGPGDIEIIVALDPDEDYPAYQAACPYNTKFAISQIRHGYLQLNEYLNAAVRYAQSHSNPGGWLMWFNDDMRMLTDGWDVAVRLSRKAVLWPEANHVAHANIVPIWPACWTQATGRVSPVQHMDTYLQRLGEELGRHDKIPVRIFHDRADVTGGHDDETYAQGRKLLGSEGMVPGFSHEEMMMQVKIDAGTIRSAGLL